MTVSSIPSILHQHWPDEHPPRAQREKLAAWRQLHPDWHCCLWTDGDLAELAKKLPFQARAHASSVLPWMILRFCGGVYVDSRLPAAAPLEPAIEGAERLVAVEGGRLRPWVLACAAGDPAARRALEQTLAGGIEAGLHLFAEGAQLYQCPQSHENPLGEAPEPAWHGPAPGLALGLSSLRRSLRGLKRRLLPLFSPYRKLYYQVQVPFEQPILPWPVNHLSHSGRRPYALMEEGRVRSRGFIDLVEFAQVKAEERGPKVSCLMVTQGSRFALAREAAREFLRQTWPHKELVVVDDSEDSRLERWIHNQAGADIVFVRLPPGRHLLGELRNIARDCASGEWIAQWDDDDHSHPDRLATQLHLALSVEADACLLQRTNVAVAGGGMAILQRRLWENSHLTRREVMPAYADKSRGEDTPAVVEVAGKSRMVVADIPHLYVYSMHGGNTYGSGHQRSMLASCSSLRPDSGFSPPLAPALQ